MCSQGPLPIHPSGSGVVGVGSPCGTLAGGSCFTALLPGPATWPFLLGPAMACGRSQAGPNPSERVGLPLHPRPPEPSPSAWCLGSSFASLLHTCWYPLFAGGGSWRRGDSSVLQSEGVAGKAWELGQAWSPSLTLQLGHHLSLATCLRLHF